MELDEKLVAPSDVTKIEETNNVEEGVSPLTVEELKPAAPVEPQVPGDEGLTEVQRRVNHLLQEEGSFLVMKTRQERNYQWMKIIDQKSGCGDLEIDGG